jgi:penicillin G amidase
MCRTLACICGALASAVIAPAAEIAQIVPGLREPVEIIRDRWGICHIYARNEHDLFFAQGFNATRDRLFQLELWRRQATGTLAEIEGGRALAHDVGARLLKFRGDLGQELNHYHPRGREIVDAFVAGINAYIALAEREPARLPLEFRILGIKPGKWTPEVVVSRHNGLYRNATQEVRHARLIHKIGRARARELLDLHPGQPTLLPDPALDLSLIGAAILETHRAARATVRFLPEDVKPEFRGPRPQHDGLPRAADSASPEPPLSRSALLDGDTEAQGSNNWVVAGDRTFTRSAIMANDPHRALQLPSLRYWVHLVAPGWNVIGGGEPALPGVSIGHNEHGAWGFTIFPIDQEDLYVYETDRADALRYRYKGAWETMTTIQETLAIKGDGLKQVELRYTRHGPVLYEDRQHQRAYALRAAWLEVGTAPYLASLQIDQATTWHEFRDACRSFFSPSENLVWAGVNGRIGWQAVGLAPRRSNWDGLLPVPGDGRYEWDGFLPSLELPGVVDPPQGWFASANQDNLPAGYPFTISLQWTEPFRFARIEEVLGSGRRFMLSDMMQLQQDELALPARALVPLLRPLAPAQGRTRQALERLLSWDLVLASESVPAAIYVVWERALKKALWELHVPEGARSVFPVGSLSTGKVVQWLTTPDGRFGADPIGGRDALLLDSLRVAVAVLEERLGPDMSRWQYGQARFKHIQLAHALSGAVTLELQKQLDLGPLPRGGYGRTVNNTSDDDNQTSGASFRIIADTGDWDRSAGTNTPGQSGDPESAHYRDLFQPWAKGTYFPIFFARASVESVSEEKLNLRP